MDPFAPLAGPLLVLAIVLTLGYLGSVAMWPFKPCRRCDGIGHVAGPFGAVRLCQSCDATGLRLRLGRRAWNAMRRLSRDINDFRNR